MRLIKKIDIARRIVKDVRKKGKDVGLVPTMGYLHEGHLSLVRRARKKCDFLVVSIFVNPTQFGPKEDFKQYPRDLDKDLSMLRKENVDLVFNPSVREMYSPEHLTYVEVSDWSRLLCGASRPIHFRGVVTVVLKLFNILQPDIAVFGRKDYQQAVIIRKMVKDLNLKVDVLTGPIVREKDGFDHIHLGDKIPPAFNHDDCGPVAGHNEVDITSFLFGKCGIDPELTVQTPHSDCGYGPLKRDIRNFKSCGGTQDGQNVPFIFLIS